MRVPFALNCARAAWIPGRTSGWTPGWTPEYSNNNLTNHIFDIRKHSPRQNESFFSKDSDFRSPEGPKHQKKTNLSPMASQTLKLLPIIFFFDFEFVPLYPGPKNPKFDGGSAGDVKRFQFNK